VHLVADICCLDIRLRLLSVVNDWTFMQHG